VTRYGLWLLSILGTMIGFALLSGFLIGLAVGSARAQHQGHAENHSWYNELRSNAGGSCCRAQSAEDPNGDCRPATVWRDGDGIVWARINGQTVVVPPRAVLPDHLNRHPLVGMACEKDGKWHCALVGGAGG
jgi:hypothetical protein